MVERLGSREISHSLTNGRYLTGKLHVDYRLLKFHHRKIVQLLSKQVLYMKD